VEVAAGVVDVLMLVVEIWRVDVIVIGVGMLFEKVDGLLEEIVVNESVDIPLMVERLWTADVFCDTCLLVDDVIVAAVLKDCVVRFPQFLSQHNALIS